MGRYTGILGLLTMLGLAYTFSTNRRAIRLKTVAWGLGLQIAMPIFVLRTRKGQRFFTRLGDVSRTFPQLFVLSARSLSSAISGRQAPMSDSISLFKCCRRSSSSARSSLCSTISASCNSSSAIAAWVMTRVMGASGAESLNIAASIFMGQTEAPVTIRPFLPELTQSELMTVMTSGMAHISGGMMAAYIALGDTNPKNLLSAVIMTAPGTLLMAKMLVPETEKPQTAGGWSCQRPKNKRERSQCARRNRPRNGRRAAYGSQHRRHADRFYRADRPAQWHDGLEFTTLAWFPYESGSDLRPDFRAGCLVDRRPLA